MKREGQKFNWKLFLEGLSWSLLCAIIFGGIGIAGITTDYNQPDNSLIGWFYVIVGAVMVGLVSWASYDFAWEQE